MTTNSLIPEISVHELKAQLERAHSTPAHATRPHAIQPVLIDIREPFEREIASLGGILIPMKEIPNRLSEIPRDAPVVIYCRSGGRSAKVCEFLMQQHGFTNVSNLTGGTLAWAKEIDPTMATY